MAKTFDVRNVSAAQDRRVGREDTARVTEKPAPKSAQKGDYVRLTMVLRPDQYRAIDEAIETFKLEAADRTGKRVSLGKQDFCRWLVDQALSDFEDGARPSLVESVTI